MSTPQLQVARSRVVPANDYRRERWRNGAGWTREIAAEPGAVFVCVCCV